MGINNVPSFRLPIFGWRSRATCRYFKINVRLPLWSRLDFFEFHFLSTEHPSLVLHWLMKIVPCHHRCPCAPRHIRFPTIEHNRWTRALPRESQIRQQTIGPPNALRVREEMVMSPKTVCPLPTGICVPTRVIHEMIP